MKLVFIINNLPSRKLGFLAVMPRAITLLGAGLVQGYKTIYAQLS